MIYVASQIGWTAVNVTPRKLKKLALKHCCNPPPSKSLPQITHLRTAPSHLGSVSSTQNESLSEVMNDIATDIVTIHVFSARI
jgi:hypothetical protein